MLARLYTQGGAEAYGLRIEQPAKLLDELTRPDGIDAVSLVRSVLTSTALRSAAPQLFEAQPRAHQGNVDELDAADLATLTANEMLATVMAAVAYGGAYAPSAPVPGLGLVEQICRAFVSGTDDDCLRWAPPDWWSPWFYGMGWDHTWVVCDLRT